MKVGDFSNTDIEGDDFDSIDASIDEENMGFMFDIVSNQMYRAPINSIVREITSNCFDSHIEAGVTDPVIIELNNDETGNFIAFRDFGVGISEHRMNKVYAKYFSSTKRDTNDQIGMFGLGSKSPLSYSDSFYLTTIHNGIKYEYVIHKGARKPQIVPLIQTPVQERNQTEVRIYMKESYDIMKFSNACRQELCYFDNVFILDSFQHVNNNYTIAEYGTFKFRKGAPYSDYLHLVVGKVAYPIEWSELDIKSIDIPCALKFEIGDLLVTPSREAIRYIDIETDKGLVSTKSIILAKIEEFKEEIKELYEEQTMTEFEDYQEYTNFKANKAAFILLDDTKIVVKSIIPKPKAIFKPLKEYIGDYPANLFYSWKTEFYYRKDHRVQSIDQPVSYTILTDNVCIVFPEGRKINAKKMRYLFDFAKQLSGVSSFYTVYNRPARLKTAAKVLVQQKLIYYNLEKSSPSFDYYKTNKTKQYSLMENFINSEFSRLSFNYDDIVIPQEWLDADAASRRATHTVNKTEDSFLIYNYGRKFLADCREYITTADLAKFKGFLLYGFEEDEQQLKDFRTILATTKYAITEEESRKDKVNLLHPFKCRIYKIAKRNEKHLVQFKNAIHVLDFMGNNKVFKRIATAAFISENSVAIGVKGYKVTEGSNMQFRVAMENVFPPYADAIADITDACEEYGSIAYNRVDNPVSDTFYKQLLGIVKEYDLFDKSMLDLHQKLEGYVAGLNLIKYLAICPDSLPSLVDFLAVKGKRIDSLWTAPSKYELELLQELKEKASYLQEVHSPEKRRVTQQIRSALKEASDLLMWHQVITEFYETRQNKQAA